MGFFFCLLDRNIVIIKLNQYPMSLLIPSEYYLYSEIKYLAIKEVWQTYDKQKSHVPNFKGT